MFLGFRPHLATLNAPTTLHIDPLQCLDLFSMSGLHWRHLLDELDNLKGKLLVFDAARCQRPRHGAKIMLYLLAPGADIVLRRVNVLLACLCLQLYRLAL